MATSWLTGKTSASLPGIGSSSGSSSCGTATGVRILSFSTSSFAAASTSAGSARFRRSARWARRLAPASVATSTALGPNETTPFRSGAAAPPPTVAPPRPCRKVLLWISGPCSFFGACLPKEMGRKPLNSAGRSSPTKASSSSSPSSSSAPRLGLAAVEAGGGLRPMPRRRALRSSSSESGASAGAEAGTAAAAGGCGLAPP
mmetsp:Transcript_87447/g.187593  ORF Transcript_87447/g.187593 Transcript_87447/m.187593 type:complete len:202 (-) Transcript_87447:63-668(-)